ncbi:2-dehydropantoate 2-reductase [Penicillium frequentans]|uniref:2-dehydropantoate 2-reductase n=1 Tax=Penicillium frequentans TaxID=3151616 RepID=A0AAD6GK49_9EURO|nr:2-dehydropantoate 2-reductase [Penicillium glabrum]
MAQKSRILLVGCGGVGTIAALNLEHGNKAEVSCVLRSNFEIVNKQGFTIRSCEHGDLTEWRPSQILDRVPDVTNSGIQPFDYIVCCTKNTPDIRPIGQIIAPAVSPNHTVIVLIQNGLNIEKPLMAQFPQNMVLSGVSRIDAHEVSKGVVEQKQRDLLYIGPFPSQPHDAESLRKSALYFIDIYGAAGRTTCLYKPDVGYDRWAKLVYNATLNPVSALVDLNTGELQMTSVVDTLVIPAMKEVMKVAEAVGHKLPDEIIEETIRSNPIEKMITPSMQVDTQMGSFIEHENLLGEVCREAQRFGVDAPILSTLYSLCVAVQWRTKKIKGLINLNGS